METLSRRLEWGTPQADEIIWRITNELVEAGVADSYNAALRRIRQQLIEVDVRVPPKTHPPYDGKGLDEILASELPLLPLGLERDGLLDPYHTIAYLGIAKVEPGSGEILTGSFHWPIAEVYDAGFGRIDPSFDEPEVALVLQKTLELRYSGLSPTIPTP
jgi:hypothetical protein